MNLSTLIGIVIGTVILVMGISLSTDTPRQLLNAEGVLFVFGGSLAALFMSYPMREVVTALRNLFVVLRSDDIDFERDIDEIFRLARMSSQGDIRLMEAELGRINNPFLRTGIRLLVDNTPIEDVVRLLGWRIARLKAKEAAESQVFRTLGNYAPAFGMLGTVLGLVNMLDAMGHNGLDQLAPNMAIALLTTFYGLLLANMVFKPIAVKLERRTEKRIATLTMVLEGIELMSQHRSPSMIRETLYSFMMNYRDEVRDAPTDISDDIGERR